MQTKHHPKMSVLPEDPAPLVSDDFDDHLATGKVVGSICTSGLLRKGVDREGVISIDNGALRIQPLLTPGWGRAGIAYGPYRRQNGLALAVFMLNGHNTAQSESLTETFRGRFSRWLVGAEVHRRRQRLVQWLRSKRKSRMLRQWRWWWQTRRGAKPVVRLDENLALGWFGSEVPGDPLAEGNSLVMHATGPENGELWARVGDQILPAVGGVQNLPVYYIVVLREQGAVYYAASVNGANGFGTYPGLRPIAIDPFNKEPSVHAGLFQATLGQIGFRLDTRVYGMRVAEVPGWSSWYGSAHAADMLDGNGGLADSLSEVGGRWHQVSGRFERTASGIEASDATSLVLLPLAAPTGLVHVVVECAEHSSQAVGLIWRCADVDNYWQLTVTTTGCELAIREQGQWTRIARDDSVRLIPKSMHSLQVLDDGRCIGLHLNGKLLFDTRFDDERLKTAAGVGLTIFDAISGLRLSRFEAHARTCPLPPVLDQGAPWWRLGQKIAITETFEGIARDLIDKPTTTGGKTWQRTIGDGHLDVTGTGSAKVRADAMHPNPGRLAYTVDWEYPEFADLEVEITPPGSMRGQGEQGRAGLVFWQDDSNYLLFNNWLDDGYGGASVSCFSCLGGFEDLYDAVWSNVGARIRWGNSHRFRIAFDGMHLMVLVDGAPVLYRALTDIYSDACHLQIRRIGLIANWEWGNDTGSTFRKFCARF
ncbi:MAG: hypothetical protein WBJ68_13025 [Candidatus Dechloromonas phosphoritropha]